MTKKPNYFVLFFDLINGVDYTSRTRFVSEAQAETAAGAVVEQGYTWNREEKSPKLIPLHDIKQIVVYEHEDNS